MVLSIKENLKILEKWLTYKIMSRTEEAQTKYWAYEILSGGNKDETAVLSMIRGRHKKKLHPFNNEAF